MTAKNATIGLAAASLLAFASAQAQEKVSLGEPRDDKVQLEEPKSVPVDKEIRDLPDGVLKVKTNPDGTFKSLIVKATVEIEDILGAQKGKRQARKDAELLCKRHLSQWLKDNCAFAEAQTRVTTIITKGERLKRRRREQGDHPQSEGGRNQSEHRGVCVRFNGRPERPDRA